MERTTFLRLKKKHYSRIMRDYASNETASRVRLLQSLPLFVQGAPPAWPAEALERLAQSLTLQRHRAGPSHPPRTNIAQGHRARFVGGRKTGSSVRTAKGHTAVAHPYC